MAQPNATPPVAAATSPDMLPQEPAAIASNTTSSALPSQPSTANVTIEHSPMTVDHGAAGLENPFELREVNGRKFPVWKDTGRVPLISTRDYNGRLSGDSFGLEPEAAERAINGKEAVLDGRAQKLVGFGDLAQPQMKRPRLAGDGRDEEGRVVAQTGALREDGAVLVANDGRDEHGRVLVAADTRPTYPGHGESLTSGSGPQPAKTTPADSRPNTSPESKIIPRPEDVGTDRAKVLEDAHSNLSAEETRKMARDVKNKVVDDVARDQAAQEKANRPNETAARTKGGAEEEKKDHDEERAAARREESKKGGR
jgi:hypothetical protein